MLFKFLLLFVQNVSPKVFQSLKVYDEQGGEFIIKIKCLIVNMINFVKVDKGGGWGVRGL